MQKKFEITGFILGWFAVIAQLVLIILNRQADILETVIRFFSFFTILTNILVALFFSCRIFSPRIINFSPRNETVTALASFIFIVGFIYQIILRGIWEPTGLQLLVDELLHTIIPLFFLIYWAVFTKKISFPKMMVWLIYPVVYIIFILLCGHFSSYYPYPFLDIPTLGTARVLQNTGVIFLLILAVMGILVFLKNTYITFKNSKDEN